MQVVAYVLAKLLLYAGQSVLFVYVGAYHRCAVKTCLAQDYTWMGTLAFAVSGSYK